MESSELHALYFPEIKTTNQICSCVGIANCTNHKRIPNLLTNLDAFWTILPVSTYLDFLILALINLNPCWPTLTRLDPWWQMLTFFVVVKFCKSFTLVDKVLYILSVLPILTHIQPLWQNLTHFTHFDKNDYFSLPLTTFHQCWLLLTTFDYFRLLLTTCDYLWQFVTTCDYLWLPLTSFDYLWKLNWPLGRFSL